MSGFFAESRATTCSASRRRTPKHDGKFHDIKVTVKRAGPDACTHAWATTRRRRRRARRGTDKGPPPSLVQALAGLWPDTGTPLGVGAAAFATPGRNEATVAIVVARPRAADPRSRGRHRGAGGPSNGAGPGRRLQPGWQADRLSGSDAAGHAANRHRRRARLRSGVTPDAEAGTPRGARRGGEHVPRHQRQRLHLRRRARLQQGWADDVWNRGGADRGRGPGQRRGRRRRADTAGRGARVLPRAIG